MSEGILSLHEPELCPHCGRPLATTTTTEQIEKFPSPYRIWGKNLEILCVLNEFGGLTYQEISEKTGISYKTVHKSCMRNLERGYIEPVETWGFRLTALGNNIIIYNNNNNRQITDKQSPNNRHIIDTCFTQLPKKKGVEVRQFTLKPWQSGRTEFEVVVVEYLLQHFKETGSKWMWKYEIDPEKIGVPPSELNKAIMKLRSSRICWMYRDRETKVLKYGLTDFFLQGYQYV